jgi:hypothetical protein
VGGAVGGGTVEGAAVGVPTSVVEVDVLVGSWVDVIGVGDAFAS